MAELGVPERRACRVLGQHRSTQRKSPSRPDDEAALTADIVALATQYGRYGYRRITAMLHAAGWTVNVKRVRRLWNELGLKRPSYQRVRTLVHETRELRRLQAGTAEVVTDVMWRVRPPDALLDHMAGIRLPKLK